MSTVGGSSALIGLPGSIRSVHGPSLRTMRKTLRIPREIAAGPSDQRPCWARPRCRWQPTLSAGPATSCCRKCRLRPTFMGVMWWRKNDPPDLTMSCRFAANQGQSRSVFRLNLPAASLFARALENHVFPTSALQSVKITLPAAVFVQGQLDARAAMRQSRHVPIVCVDKAEPCQGPFKPTRSGTVAHGCVAGSVSPTNG